MASKMHCLFIIILLWLIIAKKKFWLKLFSIKILFYYRTKKTICQCSMFLAFLQTELDLIKYLKAVKKVTFSCNFLLLLYSTNIKNRFLPKIYIIFTELNIRNPYFPIPSFNPTTFRCSTFEPTKYKK
jgi:hypothetical protein